MAVEVKICGLTRPEDASLAAHLGAWRLGVVFAGGPRLVDASQAKAIVAAAAGVPVVGVFGEQAVGEILTLAATVGLSGVQLHRDATPGEVAALRLGGLEVWQVFFVDRQMVDTHSLFAVAEGADVVLLEPRHPAGGGGHGIPHTLDQARAARSLLRGHRVALAGGLQPDSVAEAIRVVGPDVVDVSSGVEQRPGIKDSDRLARFLENVRDAGPASRNCS